MMLGLRISILSLLLFSNYKWTVGWNFTVGGLLRALSHVLSGKSFHLIVKKKKKKTCLNSCSHGNTFWDERLHQNSAEHLEVPFRRGQCLTMSQWEDEMIYIYNFYISIYQTNSLHPMACVCSFAPFTHVSLLEFHIPGFLAAALRAQKASAHPPHQHASHSSQAPLWSSSKSPLSPSF